MEGGMPVDRPSNVGLIDWRAFRMVVSADKLPGTAGGGISRDSLAWLGRQRSMFGTEGGDRWDEDPVSVMSDRVRQNSSTQNA